MYFPAAIALSYAARISVGIAGSTVRMAGHDRVRELVDEDVLAPVARTRIAEQVLLGACGRIATKPA